MMSKAIFVICLCLPGLCGAQNHTLDFGLSTPFFFRQAQTHTDAFQHLFGAIGVNIVLRVNGRDETDMSFVVNAGISDDVRKYSPSTDFKIKNSLYFVNINPSVVIPSKWQNIQFCMGIGTLVRLGQDVAYSWVATSSGGGTSVDSMDRLLSKNARSIVPYVSLGLSDDIRKHWRLEFTIRPTLLNFYEPGTNLNFTYATGNSYGGTRIELNYQPVYVGIQLFYFRD